MALMRHVYCNIATSPLTAGVGSQCLIRPWRRRRWSIPEARSVISLSDLEAAERVLGVAYTEAERSQIVGSIEGQNRSLARRAVRLTNATPTASRFDPRLASFRMPTAKGLGRFAKPMPASAAAGRRRHRLRDRRRTSQWSPRGARAAQADGDLSDPIEALGPKLECSRPSTLDLRSPRRTAPMRKFEAASYLGPLHGIPYGLKDLFDTKGVRDRLGRGPCRVSVPECDAEIVRKLRAGWRRADRQDDRLALSALDDIWYGGRTRNPWNLNEGSSGSSAGSASATAAGLCASRSAPRPWDRSPRRASAAGRRACVRPSGRVSRAGGHDALRLARQGRADLPLGRGYGDRALHHQWIPTWLIAARSTRRSITTLRPKFRPAARLSPGGVRRRRDRVDRAALDAARRLGVEIVEVSLPDLLTAR